MAVWRGVVGLRGVGGRSTWGLRSSFDGSGAGGAGGSPRWCRSSAVAGESVTRPTGRAQGWGPEPLWAGSGLGPEPRAGASQRYLAWRGEDVDDDEGFEGGGLVFGAAGDHVGVAGVQVERLVRDLEAHAAGDDVAGLLVGWVCMGTTAPVSSVTSISIILSPAVIVRRTMPGEHFDGGRRVVVGEGHGRVLSG